MENKTKIALNEIKKILGMKLEEEIVIEFKDAKTKDGIVLKTDTDFVVGANLIMVDDAGKDVPALDNEYELEDGTLITSIDGKISEVESAGEEGKEEVAQACDCKNPQKMAEQLELILSKVNEAYKPVFTDILNAFKTLEDKLSASELANTELANQVAEFSKQPQVKQTRKIHDIDNMTSNNEIVKLSKQLEDWGLLK